jgi:putative salt-induced outer membrane protein YdiY
LLLLAASPPLAAAAAFVDVITVKDDSILKGEIKRVENDELILDTDYADDVVIDVGHIVNIESKQQFSIRLLSGEIISGFLAVSNGKIVLRESLSPPGEPEAEQAPEEIDLAEPVREVPPATPAPRANEIVQRADGEPSDSPAAVEHPDGRKFSFDDVDWIREKPTYLRYDAALNVGVQLARGNTDTTDLHFDALFEPSFGWNTLRLSGQYDKKTADGDTTTNRWKAALAYERDFRRRWFVGAANTYEADAQRDLDLRFIIGAGIGYRFYDQDPTHFSVLPALVYVNENFEEASDDTQYAAIQLSMDFERDLYKDDITFFHDNMYLNNLQSLSDIKVETHTGIKFDMPWDLVLTAEVETDWENEPAEDAEKLDTRYMLKIGFEFEGDEDDWFH